MVNLMLSPPPPPPDATLNGQDQGPIPVKAGGPLAQRYATEGNLCQGKPVDRTCIREGKVVRENLFVCSGLQTVLTCCMTIAYVVGSLGLGEAIFHQTCQLVMTSCGTRFLGREKMAVLAVHTGK